MLTTTPPPRAVVVVRRVLAASAACLSGLLLWNNLHQAVFRVNAPQSHTMETVLERMIESMLSEATRTRGDRMTATSAPDDDDDDDDTVIVPRAFDPWPPHDVRPLPCFDPLAEVNSTKNETWWSGPVQKRPPLDGRGLFYLKLTKTASSTSAGVHLRVARRLAQRLRRRQHDDNDNNATTAPTDWPVCRSRFLHGFAGPKMFRYARRDRTRSYLWTTLRQPTARYVSEFLHFQVGRRGADPRRTWKSFLRRGPHSDHHSLSWLSVRGYRYGRSDPYRTARSVLAEYDFIGLVERYDESLVLLSLLLRVPLRDVLYLPSKVSGAYDDLCAYIPTADVVPPAMRAYVNGSEWRAYVAPEAALWEAVNVSLDMTVEALGRDVVRRRLTRFRTVQRRVQDVCDDSTTNPCVSVNGTRRRVVETDYCYVGDMGCGWECIDRVADEMGLPSS